MLKRVGIAQALIDDPKVLIMDEPTVSLDPGEKKNFRTIIESIKGDRIVLISSHEIKELESICDKFLFLHQGELVCNGSLEELYNRYSVNDIESLYFKIMQVDGVKYA